MKHLLFLLSAIALQASPTIAPAGQPVSATATEGQSVSFSVTADGTNLLYTWTRKDPAEGARGWWIEIPTTAPTATPIPNPDGGAPITSKVNPTANTATLTISPVTLADAGSYVALVHNSAGFTYSNEAILTVTAKPTPTPVPTPTPTPIPTPTPVGVRATIKSFSHTAAWHPAKLSWSTANSVSATLTDPTGKTIPVPVSGSQTTYALSPSNMYVWTLTVIGTDGIAVTKTDTVHGVLPR